MNKPITLQENVFNRTLPPDQPQFKIWSSAGLMLTYRCPSRCACCYVFASPDAGSPATEMSVEMALHCWRGIRRLAGERGKVHLTGGEPFADYKKKKKILQAACYEGLSGLEKIETNAYWCTDEPLVRAHLSELKRLGLRKLQISTDAYHQQYVPIERVRLAVTVATELFGPASSRLSAPPQPSRAAAAPDRQERSLRNPAVQIRWRDFLKQPILVADMTADQRRRAFAAVLGRRGERLLGRAAAQLASALPEKDYESFEQQNCRSRLLGARHVHIDGAGNIFPGTCVGIIVANAKSADLADIWRRFDYRRHPVMSLLVEQGPLGLWPIAVQMGYRPLPGYADKCHLCHELRRFLHQRGMFRQYLGPAVCYGENET